MLLDCVRQSSLYHQDCLCNSTTYYGRSHGIGDVLSWWPIAGNGRVQLFDANTLDFLATLGADGLGPADNTTLNQPATAPSGLDAQLLRRPTLDQRADRKPAGTPATIPGQDGLQSFLLTFQGTEAFTATDMAVDFDCLGVGPAPVTTGLDTVDLILSATPVADIIALAATTSENGTAIIPAGGTGAFAIATDNAGAAAASIIVSVDTGACGAAADADPLPVERLDRRLPRHAERFGDGQLHGRRHADFLGVPGGDRHHPTGTPASPRALLRPLQGLDRRAARLDRSVAVETQ